MSGSGTYNGPVVQAGRVALHFDSPRPEERPAGARSARRLRALVLSAAGALVWAATAFYADSGSLSPDAWRIAALSGPALLVVGAVWWAAEWMRERRAQGAPSEQLDRIADDLATALTDEYLRDERQQHIHDPAPIPVRWSAASPLLSDHEANIRREPITSAGSAPLDLTGDFDAIGPFYESVPSGRLVVLGAPGAGKSALVLRLARVRLKDRAPGAPVPVLLPIASWNPTEEDLWIWAARRLSAQHPGCLRTPQLAHDLITTGRVLPILDGLDELPEATRPKALSRLRRSLNEPARLVLTCRFEEYEGAVAEAQTVLPAAAVVRLDPLAVADLDAYLPRTALRTDPSETAATKWTPVLKRLADPTDRAPEVLTLRTVLSTPLMVSLARFGYSETRADPGELLSNPDFRERMVMERHLFDAFLSAAYEDSGERARKWVGYLAAHLRRRGEQDIAWWRLGEVVPWSVRWLGTGLSVGVAAVAVGLTSYDHPPWRDYIPVPPWAAVLLLGSTAALFDWAVASPGYPPQRLYRPAREELREMQRWLWPIAVGVLFALAITVALDAVWDDFPLGDLETWAPTLLLLAISVLTCLLGLTSHPADPADAPEPAALLRSDLLAQLVLCLAAPLRPTHRRCMTEVVLMSGFTLVFLWQMSVDHHLMNGLAWSRTVGLAILAWILCRWSVSAAGRLTVARLYFFATGALPWPVMTFLSDAHRRGVLRQSGGLYRFRHIELRNRLAEAAGVTEDGDSGPDPAKRETSIESIGGQALGNLFLLLVSAGLTVYFLAPQLTYPYRAAKSPCALLSVTHVRAVIVEPVKVTESEFSCEYSERSPFRPARTLEVRVNALRAFWGSSGIEDARSSLRSDFDLGGRSPTPGLGDEWMGSVMPLGPHSAPEATVAVRAANLIVTVAYAEEYATARRVTEVARILAEEVLRGAGVPPDRIHVGDRELADVPEAEVPEKTRVSGYRRPERAAYGAVWRDDDPSDIQTIDGISVSVRTPPEISCDNAAKGGKGTHYASCWGAEEATGRLNLHMTERLCPEGGCTPAQTRDFQRAANSWRDAPTQGVRYAVDRGQGGWYQMSLLAQHIPEGGSPRLVLVRASVWEGDGMPPDMAQKIVNSVYTQISPPLS
ncbi:NACHT domain-containing protein [Streptomyces cinnabarinus]|uniref:NACHT domain-containing protein n=1 Tax=Streptomyces cinnabarinus TaxID=67287 RepID=A0ABY7KIY7_9ACTN|nr:NACHT domain-containing protein [Streptomyces cinnabarinus]WAZ23092.1 NACHT domain-containing protein [Streptomyces cinnabarinus]